MLYTDIQSLVLAITQADASDKQSLERFGAIAKAYYDALHNPPDGTVGVGCVTHAESEMIRFQLESNT